MKKLLVSALAVSMLLSLTACGTSSTESVSEENKKPTLKVGTSADYPPFEYHAEVDGKDTIVGVDIELANYICDALGYELELVDMSFDGLIGSLNEGNFDLILSGLSADPNRDCLFTVPYYGANQALITTKDKVDMFQSTEDMMGKKISGLMGSIQEGFAVQYAGDTAVAVQNFQDSVMMVMEGGLDGIICESGVADTVIAANSDLVIADVYIDDGDNTVCGAVKKGNEALVEEINPILNEVVEKGLVEEWLEKHQ